MRYLFQTSILLLIIGCSPKVATVSNSDFDTIISEIESDDVDYIALIENYPNFQFLNRKIIKTEPKTKREEAAVKLEENKTTAVITNDDNSSGIIKVIKIQPNAKMRVSYIYLNDSTSHGEKLANVIIEEFNNGKSFVELAKQYSKDPNGENGGDLGWFQEESMIKDFTQAIRKHNKGDIFKTLTSQYGWYVILYTHEFVERIEYHIIEIVKKD
jgi:parvulin-like peptidyl-prolyl isomerase